MAVGFLSGSMVEGGIGSVPCVHDPWRPPPRLKLACESLPYIPSLCGLRAKKILTLGTSESDIECRCPGAESLLTKCFPVMQSHSLLLVRSGGDIRESCPLLCFWEKEARQVPLITKQVSRKRRPKHWLPRSAFSPVPLQLQLENFHCIEFRGLGTPI